MRQGKGILMSIKCPDHKYEGGFEMDLPHGQGEFQYKNGHRYTGGFYQGLFLGYGVYYVPKSHVFSGHFLFGNRYGIGECIYSNGLKFKGNYDDDKRHRYGRFVTPDGEITCGFWNRGRRQHQMLEIKKESSVPNREDLDYDDFLIGNPASLSKLQANMAKISSIIADRILRQKDPEFRVYVSEFNTGRKLKNTSKELSFDATFQKFCEQWTDKTSRNMKSPTAVAERPRHNGSFISDYAASQTVLSEDEVVHNQERSVYAPMEHANDLEIQREPVMEVTQNPFAEEADSSSKSISGRQKTHSAPLEDLQNNGSECS